MIPFEKIKQSPLVKQFIENRFDNKNVLVYAEGGFGKTTAMHCLQTYLLDLAQKEKIVPLYIDVKKIDQFSNKPLIHYIYTEYSGSDAKESDVENLFTDQAPSTQYKYKYYILIDGYNEVPVSARFNINSEISNFAQRENVRIILSSRLNEQVDIFKGFKRISLLGLNNAQIKLYLKKHFDMDFDLEKVNQSLVNILRSPLYMSVFSKTYGIRKSFPELFSEKEVRKGDILDNFIFHSLDKLRPNENINDLLAEFILLYFMPALAFKMYKNENFTITKKEMEQLVDDIDYFKSLFDIEKQGKYLGEYSRNIYDIEKICCDNIAVLQRTGYGYEMHNIYRDFFAAKQVINFINAGLINELEIDLDENIRQFVGELIREYDETHLYSRDYANIDSDDRKCECDFEAKNNLETWAESPVEYFLQNNYKLLNEKPIVIRNLIDIMKTCRNNCITADYSYLDLTQCNFITSNYENGKFCGSKLCFGNFINNNSFSAYINDIDDNRYVTKKCRFYKNVLLTLTKFVEHKFSAFDKIREKGVLTVYNIDTGMQIKNVDAEDFEINADNNTLIYFNANTIYICRITGDTFVEETKIRFNQKSNFHEILISPDNKCFAIAFLKLGKLPSKEKVFIKIFKNNGEFIKKYDISDFWCFKLLNDYKLFLAKNEKEEPMRDSLIILDIINSKSVNDYIASIDQVCIEEQCSFHPNINHPYGEICSVLESIYPFRNENKFIMQFKNHSIVIYDYDSKNIEKVLYNNSNYSECSEKINCSILIKDKKFITCSNNTIMFIDCKKNKICSFAISDFEINSFLGCISDEKLLCLDNGNNSFYILNLVTKKFENIGVSIANNTIQAICSSVDKVVFGDEKGIVRIYDIYKRKIICHPFNLHRSQISFIEYFSKQNLFISKDKYEIIIWNIDYGTNKILINQRIKNDGVELRLLEEKNLLAFVKLSSGVITITFYDLANNMWLKSKNLKNVNHHCTNDLDFDISDDGSNFFYRNGLCSVGLFDLNDNKNKRINIAFEPSIKYFREIGCVGFSDNKVYKIYNSDGRKKGKLIGISSRLKPVYNERNKTFVFAESNKISIFSLDNNYAFPKKIIADKYYVNNIIIVDKYLCSLGSEGFKLWGEYVDLCEDEFTFCVFGNIFNADFRECKILDYDQSVKFFEIIYRNGGLVPENYKLRSLH